MPAANIRLTINDGPDFSHALSFVRHYQGDYNRNTRVWTLKNTPAIQAAILEVNALGMTIVSGVNLANVTDEPYRVHVRKLDVMTLDNAILAAPVVAWFATPSYDRIGGRPWAYAVTITDTATGSKRRLTVVDWTFEVQVLNGDVVTRYQREGDSISDVMVRYAAGQLTAR